MKKLLFVILLIIIILSCKTKMVALTYTLPLEPQRQEIILPEDELTVENYAEIILYYYYLVQKWEKWAKSVKKILGVKDDRV